MVASLEENEAKVGAIVGQIRSKLDVPDGTTLSDSSLRQVRQKAAQLSETVADIERTNNPQAVPERPTIKATQAAKDLSAQIIEHKKKRDTAASPRRWIVVGGADAGGVKVQLGSQALAEDRQGRLATGAVLEEIARDNGKLLFEKSSGEGPSCGWITMSMAGEPLVVEV